MKDRVKKVIFGVVAVGAMALGGSAIAGAVSSTPTPVTSAVQSQGTATDKSDANEKAEGPEQNDANEKAEGPEQADANEKADGSEKGEANESGAETPDDDGPGGHADETDAATGSASSK